MLRRTATRVIQIVDDAQDGGPNLSRREAVQIDEFRVRVVQLRPVAYTLRRGLPERLGAVPEWRQSCEQGQDLSEHILQQTSEGRTNECSGRRVYSFGSSSFQDPWRFGPPRHQD